MKTPLGGPVYVAGRVLSNRWGIAFALVLFVWMAGGREVHAQDRQGYVGVSLLTPLEVDPRTKVTNETYAIDVGVFYDERWAAKLSWDLGLNGDRRMGIAVGPQVFLLRDSEVTPYFSPKFLYVAVPNKDFGWRINAGVEWNLNRLTGIDNIRLCGETGASQIYLDSGSEVLAIEILRVGFSWSY